MPGLAPGASDFLRIVPPSERGLGELHVYRVPVLCIERSQCDTITDLEASPEGAHGRI